MQVDRVWELQIAASVLNCSGKFRTILHEKACFCQLFFFFFSICAFLRWFLLRLRQGQGYARRICSLHQKDSVLTHPVPNVRFGGKQWGACNPDDSDARSDRVCPFRFSAPRHINISQPWTAETPDVGSFQTLSNGRLVVSAWEPFHTVTRLDARGFSLKPNILINASGRVEIQACELCRVPVTA